MIYINLGDIIQINDWKFKKFLIFILAFHFTVWGLLGFDLIHLEVPILRPFVVLIYLLFIPGMIILRILKLHNLGNIETVLHSIGISISFLILSGAFINYSLPLIGVEKPISEIPLVIGISSIILCLLCISYLRDHNYKIVYSSKSERILSTPTLILLLIPILAVFGAYVLKSYGCNIPLIVVLIVISFIPFLILQDIFPEYIYPFLILTIAFSLLSHVSFTEVNSLRETFMPGVVLNDGIWKPYLADSQNALLSDTILHPIYAILMNLDIIWSVRLLNAIIFSFIPLAMYSGFTSFMSKKKAFYSCFFFMSLFYFYFLPFTIRRGTPMLFIALLLSTLANNQIDRINKSVLLIFYFFTIVSSHYGTSYILIFSVIFALLIRILGHYFKLWDLKPTVLLSKNLVTLFLTLCLTWYSYIASSTNIRWVARLIEFVMESMSDFYSIDKSNVLYTITQRNLTFSNQVIKYLLLISAFFIFIGFLDSFYVTVIKEKTKMNIDYIFLSSGLTAVCILTLLPIFPNNSIVPFFIFLVLLSPFCILGLSSILGIINRYIKISTIEKDSEKLSLCLFVIFIFTFFIFNSGLVSEIFTGENDYSPNALLEQNKIINSNNIYAQQYLYGQCHIPTYDIYTQNWVILYKNSVAKIYCDNVIKHSRFRVINFKENLKNENIPVEIIKKDTQFNGYLLIAYHNLVNNIVFQEEVDKSFDLHELNIENRNVIYSNGKGLILY